MGLFLFCSAAVSYLCSAFFHFLYLFTKKDRTIYLALGILVVGFALHIGSFGHRWVYHEEILFSNFFESLFFASLILIAIYLLTALRYRFAVLGAWVVPVTVILMYFSKVVDLQNFSVPASLHSHWRWIHVGMAILGQALLGVASFISFLYSIQQSRLKKRALDAFSALPALEILDLLHFRTLLSGFAALSIGIVTGALWAAQIWETSWLWEPKQLWTFSGWLMYALLLQGRIGSGLRGRKAAWYALIGFVLLLFNFFGVTFLFPGRHGFLG